MTREGKRVVQTVAGERQEGRGPAKPSTINRDLRTIRAMLKKVGPEYRFPGGAIFPEDETRVRWLRPEEEIVPLEPMRSLFREMGQARGAHAHAAQRDPAPPVAQTSSAKTPESQWRLARVMSRLGPGKVFQAAPDPGAAAGGRGKEGSE